MNPLRRLSMARRLTNAVLSGALVGLGWAIFTHKALFALAFLCASLAAIRELIREP